MVKQLGTLSMSIMVLSSSLTMALSLRYGNRDLQPFLGASFAL